jgi:hypothetical protein
MNKIRVELRIHGAEVSDDVALENLVAPKIRYWIKDELISSLSIRRHEESGIGLGTGLKEEEEFELHWAVIVKIIESNLAILSNLGVKYEIEVSCMVKLSEEERVSTPWIHLDAHSTSLLSMIHASVDFDLYK